MKRQRESVEVLEGYIRCHNQFRSSAPAALIKKDPEFVQRCAHAIDDMYHRVWSLPDDDPFWEDPSYLNPQTTEGKVRDYVNRMECERPSEDAASWWRLAHCEGFGDKLGIELVRKYKEFLIRDHLNIRWLIASARWSECLTGWLPNPGLRKALLTLVDLLPTLRPALAALQSSDDPYLREATTAALRVLDGGPITVGEQDEERGTS